MTVIDDSVPADLIGRTFIISPASRVGYTESELTLLTRPAVVVSFAFRAGYGHTGARETTEASAALIIRLASVWHLAHIVDAPQVW